LHRHCFNCGSVLGAPPPTTCERCGQAHYLNPKPCGEAVVIEGGRVLLALRADEPFKDAWDVPGGFCEGDEHPMHAAERELAEELGLTGEAIAYIGTWIDVYGPPARDGIHEHTANSAYLMRLRGTGTTPRLQPEEVSDVGWFALDALPERLAFPDHIRPMLRAAAARAGAQVPTEPPPDRIW
jgi:8-oxo-dGTP diphosphatase